jgi:hypothetical protein
VVGPPSEFALPPRGPPVVQRTRLRTTNHRSYDES